MPPFAPKAPIDLALKERIRVAYYEDGRPVAEVEAVAGVGRATLYRWFHAWGWPLRKPMRSRARKQGSAALPGAAGEGAAFGAAGWRPGSRDSLKARLKRLVEHRIGLLEQEAMAGIAVDPDANARAIELNARTLVTIERLGEAEPCPTCSAGGPSRSLAELRDELRGHLMRIWDEDEARRPVREGAGGSAETACLPPPQAS